MTQIEIKTFFGAEVPREFWGTAQNMCDIAAAASRYMTAEHEYEFADPNGRREAIVVKMLAAKHDLRLLMDLPCGCDEGSCEGLIG